MRSAIIGMYVAALLTSSNPALAETGPKVIHQYGPDTAYNLLDSYSPSGSSYPILISVHGGSWHVGSKDNAVDNKKEGLIGNEDYVLVSVEYRSGYDTNWQGQSNDIADAIQWVHDNAATISGDDQNIFLIGHSSGAHMAALVTADDSFGVRALVKGIAVLDSGDYDVVQGYNSCSGSTCDKYGDFWDNYDTSAMADGSPVNHADNSIFSPAIIIHRTTAKKTDQANWFETAILAGGQANIEAHSTTDSHSAINNNMGASGYSYTTQVSDFLGSLVSSGTTALLDDGFEAFNSGGWITDATVNTSQVFNGTYALKCGSTATEIVSVDLDASSMDSLEISFYYRDHGIDNSDNVYIQFFDGSNYVNQLELGTSASNNTWTQYSATLNQSVDPYFFHSNFKVRIDCAGIDNRENLRIDDVLIEGTQ